MKLPSAFVAFALCASPSLASVANDIPCAPETPCAAEVYPVVQEPSWIFSRGTYTHDPYSGARVAQYMRKPPVEPLEDERAVTSRYRRSRTNLRGIDGSVDTYYEVQALGNGRGGIDAEWERFHDAWKESYLSGSFYNQSPGYGGQWNGGYKGGGPWGGGYNGGYGGPGYGYPGYGFPGGGFPGHGHGGGQPWQAYGYGPHGGNHGGGPRHGNHGDED